VEIDENLLEAARSGETAAGPMLVSQYAPGLVKYIQLIAPGRGLAEIEEVAEVAIERAVARIHSFDPSRASFTGWIRGFARTVLKEATARSIRTVPIDNLVLAAPEADKPRSVDEGDWDAAEAALATAVASLGDTDQLILALRINEELPYEAIAEQLGVSAGACRVRYLRALRRLRDAAQDVPPLAGFWLGRSDHE
jgi:RNA polymerase sigma factor (sigma-70 family)